MTRKEIRKAFDKWFCVCTGLYAVGGCFILAAIKLSGVTNPPIIDWIFIPVAVIGWLCAVLYYVYRRDK